MANILFSYILHNIPTTNITHNFTPRGKTEDFRAANKLSTDYLKQFANDSTT